MKTLRIVPYRFWLLHCGHVCEHNCCSVCCLCHHSKISTLTELCDICRAAKKK